MSPQTAAEAARRQPDGNCSFCDRNVFDGFVMCVTSQVKC